MKKLLPIALLITATMPVHAFVQTTECPARTPEAIATDSDLIANGILLKTTVEYQPAGSQCNAYHHKTYVIRGVGIGTAKVNSNIKVTESVGIIDHECPAGSGQTLPEAEPTLHNLFLIKKGDGYIPTPTTKC